MNEPIGIVAQSLARRLKYGRFAYRAPALVVDEPPPPEPTLDDLVRAAVEKYMGTTGKLAIERAVTSALTEQASQWRQDKLTKAEIAAAVLANPIDRVLEIAADITGISVDVMRKPDRRRHVAWRRHFAIALLHCARRDLSTSQIGRVFGGQDHTTILHALQQCISRRLDPQCEGWFMDPRAAAIFAGSEYALNGSGAEQ